MIMLYKFKRRASFKRDNTFLSILVQEHNRRYHENVMNFYFIIRILIELYFDNKYRRIIIIVKTNIF